MICTHIESFLSEDDNLDGYNLIRIGKDYGHQIDFVRIMFGFKLGVLSMEIPTFQEM